MRDDYSSGWACVDCVLYLANGETPDVPEETVAAYLACIDEKTAGYHVSLGMLQEEHDTECPRYHDSDSDVECDCERMTFSGIPCAVCGSTLAGERQAVTFWPQGSNSVPALTGEWPAEVAAALAG